MELRCTRFRRTIVAETGLARAEMLLGKGYFGAALREISALKLDDPVLRGRYAFVRHGKVSRAYQGWWELVESRCIAVVGTRKPTEDGLTRTRITAWLPHAARKSRRISLREFVLLPSLSIGSNESTP
jgi:hypothetical protein